MRDGALPAGWTTFVLGTSCSKIGSGATPRGGASVYQESGVAFIRSQNVLNEGFSAEGLAYIDDEQAAQLQSVEIQADDVLLNITGDSVGRVCQAPADVLPARVNQHVAIIRPWPEVLDPAYVRYYLVSGPIQNELLAMAAGGATRNALTKGMVERFEVLAPADVNDQRAISAVLRTIDHKIELNRRTGETLEAMARALFQSWFVDFEPVRAKGDGEPETATCERLHLSPELLARFPDEFADSPVGEVPAGWGVVSLAEASTYLSRGISPKYVESGGILVLNQRCVRDGKVDVTKGRRHDVMARAVGGRELRTGDVLVNSTGVGTLGRIAQVATLSETTVVDSHVTVVRANEQVVPAAYMALSLSARQNDIEALAEGSTGQTELSRARLGALGVLLPPGALLTEFAGRVAPLRAASHAHDVESRALAAARDALLPQLLSGDLRVPLLAP